MFRRNGYRVLLLSGSRTRAKRLAEDLRDQELTAVYTEDPMREVQAGEVLTYYGHVGKGFEYPMLKFVVLSETDIFGAEKKKRKSKKRYQGQRIKDFNELKVGDYVVHESHGLGIYQGIEKVEMEGVVKDYIKIEYRDGGNLYVLATGLDVIQKYASADARKPKLNRLGSKEWERTKTKVRSAVNEVAKDLVELYAVRQQSAGYSFEKDTVWQREFEEMFPFEETEDQLAAIMDTKADMESGKIMDRLICGDVGYGKTEIGGVQGGTGGKTGGVSGTHHHSGPAALCHLYPAHEGFSHTCGTDEPFPDAGGNPQNRGGTAEGPGGYCHRNPQSAVRGCEIQGLGSADY